MSITILIVENEIEWLNIFQLILRTEADMSISGFTETKEKAVELAKKLKPDIILMDLNLSSNDFDGIPAITQILSTVTARIIVTTNYLNNNLVEEAFLAGAVEYILKGNIHRLPEIIRAVYTNKSPLVMLGQAFLRQAKAQQFNKLSGAEKEILKLRSKGYTNPQIQKMLNKSQSTVKTQINNMLRKLRVTACDEALEQFKDFIES